MKQDINVIEDLFFIVLVTFYLANLYLVLVFKIFELNAKFLRSYTQKMVVFLKKSFVIILFFMLFSIFALVIASPGIIPPSGFVEPVLTLFGLYILCWVYTRITIQRTVQSRIGGFLEYFTIIFLLDIINAFLPGINSIHDVIIGIMYTFVITKLVFFFLNHHLPFSKKIAVIRPDIACLSSVVGKELVAVLEMQKIYLDKDYSGDGARGIHDMEGTYADRFNNFFHNTWHFLVFESRVSYCLNILVRDGSFETFIMFHVPVSFIISRAKIDRFQGVIQSFKTAICSHLKIECNILSGPSLLAAMDSIGGMKKDGIHQCDGNKQTIHHRGVDERNIEARAPLLHFNLKPVFHDPSPSTINRKNFMNHFIKTALADGLDCHYYVHFNPGRGSSKVSHFGYLHEGSRLSQDLFELYGFKIGAGVFVDSRVHEIDHMRQKIIGLIQGNWQVQLCPSDVNRGKKSLLILRDTSHHVFYACSNLLFKFIHLPSMASLKQEQVLTLDVPAPPETICNRGRLNIGTVITNGRALVDFFINLDDLKRHVFINGTTGSGKSTFVRNLIAEISTYHEDLPFLLIEIKGDYRWLQSVDPRVSVLEPGINFKFNIFEPIGDPDIHAERLFNAIKTSYITDASEFSPQMEKILVELLKNTSKEPDPGKRTFTTFYELAREYVRKNRDKTPYLETSWTGIENRIRRLTHGPLSSVLDSTSPLRIDEVLKQKAILSLNSIIKLGGSKEDLFFFSNLLFKTLWDVNLSTGTSPKINHITIVDDAQYHVPEMRNQTFHSYFEDVALLLRGTGEVLIAISTRPTISDEIISNCGVIVCFQTKFRDDIDKLEGLLHLQGRQKEILEILPEHVCVMKINAYNFPFLIQTKTHFIQDSPGFPDARVPRPRGLECNAGKQHGRHRVKKNAATMIHIEAENMETDPCIKSLTKHAMEYQILDDKKWNDFQEYSNDEIAKIDYELEIIKEKMRHIYDESEQVRVYVSVVLMGRSRDAASR